MYYESGLAFWSFFLWDVVAELIMLLGLPLVQAPILTSTAEPVMFQYMPPGPSEGPAVQVRDTGFHLDAKLGSGKPSLYMVLLSVCGCYYVWACSFTRHLNCGSWIILVLVWEVLSHE